MLFWQIILTLLLWTFFMHIVCWIIKFLVDCGVIKKRNENVPLRISSVASDDNSRRDHIPERVRHEVWRRDQGRCVKCGSQQNLEYDHIIPVSKGGSNTARNIQLLCEGCNRKKSDSI